TVAVRAILRGQKPVKGALPVYGDHPHSLFTLLGSRYQMRVTESQTRLCPQRLCERRQGNTASRLSSLYSDARALYLHLVAPPALEDELPVIDESWGNFGSGTGTVTAGRRGLPKVDFKTFYRSRVRDFTRFVASFRPPGSGRPTLYSLHVLLPHTPWLTSPTERSEPLRGPTRLGASGSAGSTTSSRSRRGSGTSCRWATPTGCSGPFSGASTKPGSGTVRSSSSPRTTASASAAATFAGARRSRTSPGSGSRRSSSGCPASSMAASSTAGTS